MICLNTSLCIRGFSDNLEISIFNTHCTRRKLKTIVSSNVEFQNGYILHRLDPSLTFNIARETDFKLYNIGIKVEGVQYTQVKPFVARYSKI